MNKALKNIIKLIKKYDRIIITGHQNPDFDSFSSSLGMYEICKKYNKDTYIYISLDKINTSLNKGVQFLRETGEMYNFVDKTTALRLIDDKTLLIVVDCCNKNLIEFKELLALDTIVIDHHVVDEKLKIDSVHELIDNSSSSVAEMVTFFIDKLKIKPPAIISTFLLIGIEVDTNGYIMKTTYKTFNASSILLKLNADNKLKIEILKDTRENYIRKTKIIKRSVMIKENIMLCILDHDVYNQKDLAEIADELIQFEYVEASFVIGKIEGKKVSISARSLGIIDVQQIMNKLGGGGSQTSSAAQFENVTIKEVKDKLLNLIK